MPEMKIAKYRVQWAMLIATIVFSLYTKPAHTADESRPRLIPLRYLALGDSYTIGEGVDSHQRWPVQLSEALQEHGYIVEELALIAQTGWTTGDLMACINQQNVASAYDLVSLMIGVNNQYQGRDINEYRNEFRALLENSIGYAGGDSRRVIVLSIPDWGVTPFGKRRDQEKIKTEIDFFNRVNREETEKAGARFIDITLASRKAAGDRELIASDGLHPSGKLHAAWANLVIPEVLSALKSGGQKSAPMGF